MLLISIEIMHLCLLLCYVILAIDGGLSVLRIKNKQYILMTWNTNELWFETETILEQFFIPVIPWEFVVWSSFLYSWDVKNGLVCSLAS